MSPAIQVSSIADITREPLSENAELGETED